MILQECAVCPLSPAEVAVEHQRQHVTATAEVTAHAARLPLDDRGTGQGGEDNGITGAAALAVHAKKDGQVIQEEVQHGGGWFAVERILRGQAVRMPPVGPDPIVAHGRPHRSRRTPDSCGSMR